MGRRKGDGDVEEKKKRVGRVEKTETKWGREVKGREGKAEEGAWV